MNWLRVEKKKALLKKQEGKTWKNLPNELQSGATLLAVKRSVLGHIFTSIVPLTWHGAQNHPKKSSVTLFLNTFLAVFFNRQI